MQPKTSHELSVNIDHVYFTGYPKKNFPQNFLKDFFKTVLYSKTSCMSSSSKKEINILSHITKKLQAWQFLHNCLSEKAPGSKKLKNICRLIMSLTFNKSAI